MDRKQLPSPPPDIESEIAVIGQRINEVARRLSSGNRRDNDISELSDLIRRRANLLRPMKEKA